MIMRDVIASVSPLVGEERGGVRGHDASAGGSRPSWYGAPVAVAVATAAAATLVALVDPGVPGRYPVCPFLALTGHYCPGCGALRAVHALTHGDIRQALDLNVLLVLAIPLLVAWYAWWVRQRWRERGTGGARPRHGPTCRAYWLTGVVFVVMPMFGVLRNLPAFAVLAP